MRRVSVLAVATGMLVALAVHARAGGGGIDYLGVTQLNCTTNTIGVQTADDSGRARALYLYLYPDGGAPGIAGWEQGKGPLQVDYLLIVVPGTLWWAKADMYAYNVRTGANGKLIDTVTISFSPTCP